MFKTMNMAVLSLNFMLKWKHPNYLKILILYPSENKIFYLEKIHEIIFNNCLKNPM